MSALVNMQDVSIVFINSFVSKVQLRKIVKDRNESEKCCEFAKIRFPFFVKTCGEQFNRFEFLSYQVYFVKSLGSKNQNSTLKRLQPHCTVAYNAKKKQVKNCIFKRVFLKQNRQARHINQSKGLNLIGWSKKQSSNQKREFDSFLLNCFTAVHIKLFLPNLEIILRYNVFRLLAFACSLISPYFCHLVFVVIMSKINVI